MPTYRFALRNDVDNHEELGYLALRDDEEALSFGRGVIQDIMREHTPTYSGSIMQISEGERDVASLLLGADASERQKKIRRA